MFTKLVHRFVAISLASVTALALSSCAANRTKSEAQLHARIGAGLLQQGRYPEALRELLTAEKLNPTDAAIQNNLGLAYFMRDRYTLAAEKLRRAIELDPKYTEARNNLGRVLIELDQYDQALRELRIVVADLTYPDPAKAYVNIGLAYFRKRSFDDARGSFAKAIETNRNNCLAHTYFGRSLLELGKFDAASKALDNASLVCPEGATDEAKYFGGLAYYKLGKTSLAVSRMEDVIKSSRDVRYAKKAEELLKLMR